MNIFKIKLLIRNLLSNRLQNMIIYGNILENTVDQGWVMKTITSDYQSELTNLFNERKKLENERKDYCKCQWI